MDLLDKDIQNKVLDIKKLEVKRDQGKARDRLRTTYRSLAKHETEENLDRKECR